ncbi:hypothetical protein OS493_011467 [Desmophyllum pertusum]|uniref:Integral membrane protein 2 n=1 Tax=Desmophyllum pertusum TaxID=174260 RepID=A0A9X0CKY4_9CNID|nr:hypothetical protein OS493_011467 [Desmophyllum pertusum]
MNDKRLFVAIVVLYLATTVQGTATFKVQVRHEGRVFNEVVKINVASNTETFHVPAQEGFDAAEIIHDFYQKLTMISLPEKHVCYVSQLSDNLPRPGRLVKAFTKAATGATGRSDSNLERVVKTAMLVKELIQDRSNLSQGMRKQCQSFPIYRIEPVEDLISITLISNHGGDSQDRVRRSCSSSVCVKAQSCYLTCPNVERCKVCHEVTICKDINC